MRLAGEQRALPAHSNPILKSPPPYQELVESRRLGQTNLGEKLPGYGPFSYVHLRISLPSDLDDQELFGSGAPESYFLMRRSKDGFISATGMFKASFPYAKKVEEELEKQYVKSCKNTSKDETAGNIWVAPMDALVLADEYGIRMWIDALLDNEPPVPSDHRKRGITPPPPFFRPAESDAGSVTSSAPPFFRPAESDAGSVTSSAPPSTGTPRRSTRSMSPGKRVITPRKSRASKATVAKDSPLKKMVAPIVEETSSVATTEATVLAATTAPFTNGKPVSATTPVKKEPAVRVQVDEATETNGDTEIKTTHVMVELPAGGAPPSMESTEEMIAKAREMVAEARKLEGESAPSGKRKAEDDLGEPQEQDEQLVAEETGEERKAKRSKVLEDQLRRERIKNRALLGLSATLALGALLPYVL